MPNLKHPLNPLQTLKLLPQKKSTYKQKEKIRRGRMETNSQKPKEQVGITNEPSFRLTITHVCALLFKGFSCLPCLFCLALVLFCFTLPCPIDFVLPCPTLPCLALPCPAQPLTMPTLLWLCLLCVPLVTFGNTSLRIIQVLQVNYNKLQGPKTFYIIPCPQSRSTWVSLICFVRI